MSIFDELLERSGIQNIKIDEPMSRHTTFKVGGPAHYFAEPQSAEELMRLIALCEEGGCPVTIVGRGSNLLVSDRGYAGMVIHIGERMGAWSAEGCEITAGAGASLGALAAGARDLGLTGLEFAAGIPGSLGGALIMNAGAYGGEMKDIVTEVRVLRDGQAVWIPAEEMAFRYRGSAAADNGWTVLGAKMLLAPGDKAQIKARMDDLQAQRRSKQPLEYPSAGSTFKRPEGYFAGKLIQDAGLAGYTIGGAQVSSKHCGFVINAGGATASDIMALIDHVIDTVRADAGVTLEPEVKMLGEF